MTDHLAPTTPRFRASRLTTLTFIVALAGAGCPVLVAAQESGGLRVTLGAGVGTGPAYPGSGERRSRALPVVNARWGRWFLGPVPGGTGLGIGGALPVHWRRPVCAPRRAPCVARQAERHWA